MTSPADLLLKIELLYIAGDVGSLFLSLHFGLAIALANGGNDGMRDWLRHIDAAQDLRELLFFPFAFADGFVSIDIDIAVVLHPGAGRNEPAHDDVLLQAAQVIDATGNRRLSEHTRRLLERRRRDKRIGRERSLGDAEQ